MRRSAPRPSAWAARREILSAPAASVPKRTIRSASHSDHHVAPIHLVVVVDAEQPRHSSRAAPRSNASHFPCSPGRPTDARCEETVGQRLPQQRHGSAILNIRRVHPGSKNQATRIDEDMAFAPIDTFGTVVAADAADTSGSNRLAVDDASTWLRVASSTRAELLTEDSVQVLPRAIQTPQSEVVIRGLPGWKLMREQPPSTARPDHIEDGVQDLANRMKPRSAEKLWRRKKRVNTSKFSVRQVGQVRSPKGQTPPILPAKPTHVPVFRQSLVVRHGSVAG